MKRFFRVFIWSLFFFFFCTLNPFEAGAIEECQDARFDPWYVSGTNALILKDLRIVEGEQYDIVAKRGGLEVLIQKNLSQTETNIIKIPNTGIDYAANYRISLRFSNAPDGEICYTGATLYENPNCTWTSNPSNNIVKGTNAQITLTVPYLEDGTGRIKIYGPPDGDKIGVGIGCPTSGDEDGTCSFSFVFDRVGTYRFDFDKSKDGLTLCSTTFVVGYSEDPGPGFPTSSPPQPPTSSGDLCLGNIACQNCFGKGDTWTAIGCIPTENLNNFVGWILGKIIFIASGGAFLLMAFGAFQVTTSSGDPKKVQAGKEMITSALTGILFIILSVFLLKLIGADILKIPGFG